MNDRIKAAAERLSRGVYGSLEGGHTRRRLDTIRLADAYLTELSQHEAAAVERALPIDEAWLRSNGFTCGGPGADQCLGIVRLWISDHEPGVWRITGMAQARLATRGHVLDLLSALGITTR